MKLLVLLWLSMVASSSQAVIYSPDGDLQLVASRLKQGGYCVYLKRDGQLELLTAGGSLTEGQLKGSLGYAGYFRHTFAWFTRVNGIKDGEDPETISMMMYGGWASLWAEKHLRRSRLSSLMIDSDEDTELTTRKINSIIGKVVEKSEKNIDNDSCTQQ